MSNSSKTYSNQITTMVNPQVTEPLTNSQVLNNDGGYVFELTPMKRLRRFLILGSDGATYYQSPQKLTKENAMCVIKCLDDDYASTITEIVSVSHQGLAHKNSPALFALALAGAHPSFAGNTIRFSEALTQVARTGTHFLELVSYLDSLRGWGRGLKKAVAHWFDMPAEKLALQAIKYTQREGWALRDVLRLSHPKALTIDHAAVMDFLCNRAFLVPVLADDNSATDSNSAHSQAIDRLIVKMTELGLIMDKEAVINLIAQVNSNDPEVNRNTSEIEQTLVFKNRNGMEYVSQTSAPTLLLLEGHVKMRATSTVAEALALMNQYHLPHESIPSTVKANKEIWMKLIENSSLPIGAMIRNLGAMTSYGVFSKTGTSRSDDMYTAYVTRMLTDQETVSRARIHPFSVLEAYTTYNNGHGVKGKLSWTPVNAVTKALEQCFYLAFKNVIPTGKRILLAMDVSGSMSSPIMGSSLSCAEAGAALAMQLVRTEADVTTLAFSSVPSEVPISRAANRYKRITALTPLPFTRVTSLTQAMRLAQDQNFGATDVSLPFIWALEQGKLFDAIIVTTDNEVNQGEHPCKALENYRLSTKLDTKLVVVGMTATNFTIADPTKGHSMDVAGFDAGASSTISNFIRGSF